MKTIHSLISLMICMSAIMIVNAEEIPTDIPVEDLPIEDVSEDLPTDIPVDDISENTPETIDNQNETESVPKETVEEIFSESLKLVSVFSQGQKSVKATFNKEIVLPEVGSEFSVTIYEKGNMDNMLYIQKVELGVSNEEINITT